MIHTYIPYCPKSLGQDLGWAYNNFMENVADDDWVCFLDHDAMFTTMHWYHQLEEIVSENPDGGLFTVVTNRIGNPAQKFKGLHDPDNHDMRIHRKAGEAIKTRYGNKVTDLTNEREISGLVMLVSKKVWQDVGGFKSGFLSVDNDMHRKCRDNGYKVYLMDGVYVYHWYRGDGNKSHIQ